MFMLKIICLALCCVAYVASKDLQEMSLIDILVSEVQGWKDILTGKDNETLALLTEAILEHNKNVDNSTKLEKKCLNCIPAYQVLDHYLIKPAFDLAKAWMKCADVILDVPKFKHDKCHTSWAQVLHSIIKDRLCHLAGGPVKVKLTPQDIIDCCPHCEFKGQDMCANGGDPLAAWKFWIKFGVQIGGSVTLKKASPLCQNEMKTGKKCEHIKCLIVVEGHVDNLKPQDIIGHSAFVLPNKMSAIQAEIMTHGPVQCTIEVFGDLFSYKSGTVYRHKEGKFYGYHPLKLVGWGVDTSTNTLFWKAVDPVWGPHQGDKGVIKILRGENHCGIESNCIGSLYKKFGKMKKGNSSEEDDKKDGDKNKDGDKKKSSANFTTTNYSLFFILLITHILVGDMS